MPLVHAFVIKIGTLHSKYPMHIGNFYKKKYLGGGLLRSERPTTTMLALVPSTGLGAVTGGGGPVAADVTTAGVVVGDGCF